MTQPTAVTLLPCPFCGGEELSHGWQSPGVNGSPSTGTVQCHDCDALVFAEPGEAEAITAWNTRSPQPPSSDTRLREALERIAAPLPNEPLLGDKGWTPGKQTEFWRKLAIDYRKSALAALQDTASPTNGGEGK